ncbi:DNA polymerase ligase N-terminal domain-containing protein [Chitinophaga sp. 212800010-3]|uniref:DNA polymerase ligase N-terminal domain-containing protein n=1 Tax=unclassified Chitinophaga TaxID=2619133 RepID=UPI002DF2AF27|nr:hypothetical protein [Chitinophaga sp. 212800010-3]
MSLAKYKQKRNFSETTEPVAGKRVKGSHAFVVQRHHATRLHYDFRLEINGVLKSWAVPKGPSMNPADKRLAMAVEDHPYDYKDFEGTIPAGNYGAGTVYIWDKGTFELMNPGKDDFDKEALKELDKGDLKIVLKGKKLKGEFAVVKMKTADANAWLLIKHKDKYAVEEYNSEDYTPESVKQRGLKEKETARSASKNRPVRGLANEPDVDPLQAIKKRYKPMLATQAVAPFDDPGWLFEAALGGQRTIAAVQEHQVSLYDETGKSCLKKFPAIAAAVEKISHNVVMDGEIILLDKQHGVRDQNNPVYLIFDLLHLDGHDLQQMPLLERKQLLEALLEQYSGKPLLFSPYTQKNGKALFEKAAQQQWPGIIARKASSRYEEGKRSKNWLEIKR